MTTSLEVVVRRNLPALPRNLHPVISKGVDQSRLQTGFHGSTIEQLLIEQVSSHRAERAPYRACYWTKPLRGDKSRAGVYFMPHFDKGKHQAVGVTKNDPLAARFLIANSRAGANMPGIRWELYADPHMEELLGMGCFHQWDLLGDVSRDDLKRLADDGVKPRGNWDFLSLIWHRRCSVCQNPVGINAYACDIDSAVCARCGNRPYLAPWLHRSLEDMVKMGSEQLRHFTDHAVTWLSRLQAQFKEVRRDVADVGGLVLQSAVQQHSLIASMRDPAQAQKLRPMIEQHGIDFDLYRHGCCALFKAIASETPFREEHALTLDFVQGMTRLLEQRQLITN